MSLERLKDIKTEQIEDSGLVRRMSASPEGYKSENQDAEKNQLMDTYRSISEMPKKKKRPKIWNLFDWSFKNVSYERMSSENKRWLVLYKVMAYLAIGFLTVAYVFFIYLLFSYLIHVERGEIVDEDMFEPVNESLLHSLATLWKQRAYFVVLVVFVFSVSLPFIKLVALILAYLIAARHRRKQVHLFFGKGAPRRGNAWFPHSNSVSAESGVNSGESEEISDYTIYEDGRLIKYAREVLLILKLISKFQMIDVIILLVNISFLRSAFVWARPGNGLLYLVIYCLTSILGTQLLNVAVEGERDIFEYWRVVRLVSLPVLTNYYSSYISSHMAIDLNQSVSSSLEMPKSESELGVKNKGEMELNREGGMEMDSGPEMSTQNIIDNKTSMVNRIKNEALDVVSDGSSEAEFYEILYSSKNKEIKVRWYRCDIFVTMLVLINVVSGCLIVSKEKMFGIAFTADETKILGLDGTQFSFMEIILNLRDCWYYLPVFVFLVMSIVVPVLYHTLFLIGLYLYNHAISKKGFMAISKFDPARPLMNPCRCLNASVKATKFIFQTCNLLSEWSLGEVLALGMLAAYFSLNTADSVRFYIPPKKVFCVFALMGSFGLTSVMINVQFFMWHNRIINRLSDVTIYIESINSAKSEASSNEGSTTHLEAIESTMPKLKVAVNGSKDNLKKLESYIEGNGNEIMYKAEQTEEKKKRNKLKRTLFMVIDIIRHTMYSKFIISIFFLALFSASTYFFVFSFVHKTKPTMVNEVSVQDFLDTGVPQLFKIVKRNLPATYGDCLSDMPPPKPCVGEGSAFVFEKGIKIDMVWVTGFNTSQLVESNFMLRDDKRIQLRLHMSFKSVRPYMKVTIADQMINIYSGDSLCCGDDIHLVVVLTLGYADASPYLRDIQIENFQISNVKLFGGLEVFMERIQYFQEFIEQRIVYYGNEYLKKHEKVMQWRGLQMSPLDFVNFLIDLNYPEGLVFPDKPATSVKSN